MKMICKNKTSISNGLENFEIEEEKPELFNSENNENENLIMNLHHLKILKVQKREDDLEIPAFLRRQKN